MDRLVLLLVLPLLFYARVAETCTPVTVTLPIALQEGERGFIGTLSEVTTFPPKGPYTEADGKLVVERRFFGVEKDEVAIPLSWVDAEGGRCPIGYSSFRGKRALWILDTHAGKTMVMRVFPIDRSGLQGALSELREFPARPELPDPHRPAVLAFLESEWRALSAVPPSPFPSP